MNSRERVLGSFNRTGYDRIPVKHEGHSGDQPDDHGSLRIDEHGTAVTKEQCSAIAEKGFAVCFGTPDEVKRNVIEVNEILGKTGGFLIVPAHILNSPVPCDNVVSYVRAAGKIENSHSLVD
jgi:hypothetical protein